MTDPNLSLSFVWSATTLVLNRCLLHVHQVEVREVYIAQYVELLESRTAILSGPTPNIDELEDWQLEEQLQERDEGSKTPAHDTPLQAELNNFSTWSSRDQTLESSMFNLFVYRSRLLAKASPLTRMVLNDMNPPMYATPHHLRVIPNSLF